MSNSRLEKIIYAICGMEVSDLYLGLYRKGGVKCHNNI